MLIECRKNVQEKYVLESQHDCAKMTAYLHLYLVVMDIRQVIHK